MKLIKIITLSIIFLLSSFSYSQSFDNLEKDNWKESSLRNFYNQLDRPLKNIEGIFSGTFQGTYYKIAIFYFDNEDYYEGRILETSSKNKNWQIGDKKIVLEELFQKGNFDVKWYHPAKRNRKNEIVKSASFFRASAVFESVENSISFNGGNFNYYLKAKGVFLKRYPK
tara:strand:- start:383 stop:889 length:507 start_codon:yes stop_codon:yes gene_type:complete